MPRVALGWAQRFTGWLKGLDLALDLAFERIIDLAIRGRGGDERRRERGE
jgi:hypothetical protein